MNGLRQYMEQHRARKHARLLRDTSRKLLRIHRDRLNPQQVADTTVAADAVDGALRARDARALPPATRTLELAMERAFPRPRAAGLRENVEVFLVAAIVAMGVRTFFLQPFKIPTGSMQPTLYGIHHDPGCDPDPSVLRRMIDLVMFGRSHSRSGCSVRGDFIFVDKVSFHFRRPVRGEVVVFETKLIPALRASRGQFYIKRLVALELDELQIIPPHLRVNGTILNSRAAFERIYSCRDGYNGYLQAGPIFEHLTDSYRVPQGHFFALGDNSQSSLDGRYWGAVPNESLVGRALVVYWPFSRRTGLIN